MTPKISAIVLAYNQQDTVGRTIESILSQITEYTYEIIIGEDCSSDSTRTVCERYAAQYPNIIKLMPAAPNKGVVGNFIDCFRECAGDYAAMCAGDDWWSDKHKIQKQVSFLDANHDYVVAHGEMLHYNIATKVTGMPHIRTSVPEGLIRKKLYFRHIVNAPTACIRRSALADTDFAAWLREGFIMEDLPSWLELASKGKFHFMPEYLTTYSVGGESISHSDIAEKCINFERETHKTKLYFYLRKRPPFSRKRLTKLLNKRILKIAMSSGDSHLISEISQIVGNRALLRRSISVLFHKFKTR